MIVGRNKDVKGNSGGDLGEKKKRKEERERECHDDGGGDGNEACKCQPSPSPARSHGKLLQGHGTVFPSEPTEGDNSTDFVLLASRAMR